MLEMAARGISPQDAAAEWVSQILDFLQLELSSKIISPKNLSSLGYPDLLTTA